MRIRNRQAFTIFELLVVLVLFLLLLGLLFPLILKARAQALREQKLNNLKQLGLACHNYHDTNGAMPAGNDGNNFSASARLLPYIEQDNVFKQIDFSKDVDDKANAEMRKVIIKTFLSAQDDVGQVKNEWGATNYLFSGGSKPSLKDNDGVFFQDSKVRFADILDGTSNTIMIGETLKGDGGTKAVDIRRQHVLLKEDDLKGIDDEAGVRDFKDNKNIASDRCASWMDGRFLQGTFTATRLPNDERPDVSCGGVGGLSALRSVDDMISIEVCDGSARVLRVKKIDKDLWKALATRGGGEVVEIPDN
jgi:type II secretory pathway pseudopilin PulG